MRTTHFTLRLLAAIAVLGTLSCATDGGVGGTGISGIAIIDGNVTSDGSSAVISAAALISGTNSGILVRVRDMDIQVVTDETGRFRLEGEFAGLITLEFVEPDSTAVSTLTLDVPAGGEIQLIDVRIDRTELLASPSQISVIFEAITQTDATCETETSGTLFVKDRSAAGNAFTVLLTADTRLTEDDAEPPTCADFREGRLIRIEGSSQGGPIVATRLRILRSRAIRGAARS